MPTEYIYYAAAQSQPSIDHCNQQDKYSKGVSKCVSAYSTLEKLHSNSKPLKQFRGEIKVLSDENDEKQAWNSDVFGARTPVIHNTFNPNRATSLIVARVMHGTCIDGDDSSACNFVYSPYFKQTSTADTDHRRVYASL